MTYKTYTIAEFRKNTRMILNEALLEPITIKRFNDEFVLNNAEHLIEEPIKKTIEYKARFDVPKLAMCKEHNMEKIYCANMKHKGNS